MELTYNKVANKQPLNNLTQYNILDFIQQFWGNYSPFVVEKIKIAVLP